MKHRKFMKIMLICALLIMVTACGKINKNEVSLNSIYSEESEAGTNVYVVLDITASYPTMLDVKNVKLELGDNTINGSEYENSYLLLNDYKEKLKSSESTKVIFEFELTNDEYKEINDSLLTYTIGNKFSNMTNIITGDLTINKSEIKVNKGLEGMVNNIYSENSDDALMISSLKWKLEEIETLWKNNEEPISNMLEVDEGDCYSEETTNKGNKLLNFFSEKEQNTISLENANGKLLDLDNAYTSYEMPKLNYDTIEKYYPGAKDLLKDLDEKTNTYAKALTSLNAEECYEETSLLDLRNIALDLDNLMK